MHSLRSCDYALFLLGIHVNSRVCTEFEHFHYVIIQTRYCKPAIFSVVFLFYVYIMFPVKNSALFHYLFSVQGQKKVTMHGFFHLPS